ncbi:MAG: DUF5684 domain-containing protein [Planctomycetota bacterium]|nr:DUF5684 domain-containing protein [Planctomycetota bacterium]
MGLVFILELAFIALIFVSLWKIAEKAGRQGWEGIVPIYNTYVLTQIVGLPILWFVLSLIPCVNIVAAIMIMLSLAKVFGKEPAFAIGLILLPFVFMPLLAFSDAKYTAPAPPAPPAAR